MREMKDSGVEWIGEIPKEWNISRIGNHYYFYSGDSLTSEDIEKNGKYLVYGANGIRGFYDNCNLSGEHILIGRVGALCGNIHLVSEDIWVTEHALVSVKFSNMVSNKYMAFLFESMNLGQYSKASAQPVISSEVLRQLRIVIPKMEEQEKIAGYLDNKCAKIDSIIEKQQAIIEKLKEYKLSVITEAVTKGLDNSIEMVSCDAGWTNVMPMGWISAPIKKVTEFITCGVAATPEYTDENNGFLFLSAQNVKDGKMDYSVKRYIVPELHESLTKKRKPRRGDILQVRVGATIGNAAVVDTDEPYSVYVSLTHMRTNEMVIPEYFKYSLSNSLFQQKAMSFVDFAGSQGNLNVADMKKLKILVPTMEEQAQIVEFLNKKCDGIDEMISNRSKIVEKLQEYKKSIIYEVVTGKKEV